MATSVFPLYFYSNSTNNTLKSVLKVIPPLPLSLLLYQVPGIKHESHAAVHDTMNWAVTSLDLPATSFFNSWVANEPKQLPLEVSIDIK